MHGADTNNVPGAMMIYLLFSRPKTLDLDKVIFNTEAHPIRKAW
jgi:hypothetical protein